MPKQKKKRSTTTRRRSTAASTGSIMKIKAVERNKVSQWWYEHKRVAKPLIMLSVVLFLIFIIVEEVIRQINS